jgi:hypothetical protein
MIKKASKAQRFNDLSNVYSQFSRRFSPFCLLRSCMSTDRDTLTETDSKTVTVVVLFHFPSLTEDSYNCFKTGHAITDCFIDFLDVRAFCLHF